MLAFLTLIPLLATIYTQNNLCGTNANSINETHCLCDDYYIAPNSTNLKIFEYNSENLNQCTYKQLSLKKTFLLSFFLGPLAIDQMYIGNLSQGILKLAIPLILISAGTLLYYQGRNRNKTTILVIGKIMEFGASIILIAWWLLDWILISRNMYRDQNGLEIFNDL
jgi:hypothetical protein